LTLALSLIVSGLPLTAENSTLSNPNPYSCGGKRVVTVQDYNRLVDEYNAFRDIV
jgi:hypothetical protein